MIPSHRTARVLFCIVAGEMYLLNGFIKKTRKTPQNELAVARSRQLEILRHE